MNGRRILTIAAVGLALLLGGLFLTVALIPEERVADAVAARAEATLGQPVEIDRVGLSLFPLPGVRLSGVALGADTARLAWIDRMELRVRLLPLLGGRVVVRTLDLERPRIAVEIDSAGTANFPVLGSDTTPSSRNVTFAIDRIRVSDGDIRYVNHANGTRIRLDGWSQELSVVGVVESGELTSLSLAGRLRFDDVDASAAGAVLPARDLALGVRHDADLYPAEGRLELHELEIDLDGVNVAGSGRILGVNSGRPEVHMELGAEGIDARRLMTWVPDSLRARLALPDGRPVGLMGVVALEAAVDGTVAPDTTPDVDGILSLEDGAVTIGDAAVLRAVQGRVTFSLDSVIARFDGQALGEGFNAGLALRNPADPLAVVAFSGRGGLGRLAELGLVSDTLGLTGDINVDLRAQVRMGSPAATWPLGTVEGSGIVMAGLDPVVRVPTVTARFEGDSLRVSPFRIELGRDRSVVDVAVTAVDWIPAMVDSSAPPARVTMDVDADALDLDALYGPSDGRYPDLLFARLRDRTIDGRTPAAIAEEIGLLVPTLPPANLRLDARVGELVRNELRYTDMVARATVTPERVDLEELRFGLMGGTVNVTGALDPVRTDSLGAPVETRLDGRYGISDVAAARFFDRLTPFRDHLAGQLSMTGSFGMTLDRFALPERQSVQAQGSLAISEGRMTNWAVLQNVMARLGVTGLDTLRFRDWAGSFRIDGPRVTLDETALQAPSLDARARGWFDFGGQIDVRATAGLTRDLAQRAGAIGQELLAATQGPVPIAFQIRGSVESPEVDLDLRGVRDALAGRAQEAAEEVRRQARATADQARDRVGAEAAEATAAARDRATREAARRVELPDSLRDLPADSLRKVLGDSAYALLPDSVRTRADSLQRALENAIRERLRRLLPRGGGGGGGLR